MKRRADSPAQLLRVWQISGQELVAIPVEELSDVRSLKRHLQKTCGLPPRFRQRLLHDGEALEDDVLLDSPIDVNLAILPLVASAAEQANELAEAARRGISDRVEEFLKQAQDPDAVNSIGETPLCQAAKFGNTAVVELLLEAGADKDKPSLLAWVSLVSTGHSQLTPLGLACQHGHQDIVRLVLDCNANVHKESDGNLPLIWAASKKCPEIVHLLLEARADAHKTSEGSRGRWPPIFVAVSLGDVETTRLLLEGQADINEDRNDFVTPLGLAAWIGDMDITALLLEGRADAEKPSGGVSAIELPTSEPVVGGEHCCRTYQECLDYAHLLREWRYDG